MASINALRSSEVMLRICEQSSVDGESISWVGYGTTTSNGEADGTTLVDAQGRANSGSADALNGRYLIKILSGTNSGRWKRVVDDDGSGTLTLENNGFENQIVSGVEYAVYLDSDAGVVVLDGAASATAWNDDFRDEDDDTWKDYWAVPIKATERGEMQQVSAFDKTGGASEGLFTSGAFSGTMSAGEVLLLRKYLEAGNLSLGRSQEVIERLSPRVNMSRGKVVPGIRGGGPLSFETHLYGSGNLSADGSTARASVLSPLLKSVGLVEEISTSSAVVAGSSTTAVKITTATHERFRIGDVIMISGEARPITAKTDGGVSADTLTVSPAFTFTPVSGDTVYASRRYRKTVDSNLLGCTVEAEHDSIRSTFKGCKGNVEIADGNPAICRWTFNYEHFWTERETAPENPGQAGAYTTVDPVQMADKLMWLGTTQVEVGNASWTPQASFNQRSVSGRYGANGRAGHHLTDAIGGGTFTRIVESGSTAGDAMEDFLRGTTRALFVQYNSHGRCVCIYMPAAQVIAYPGDDDFEGMRGRPVVVRATDAGTASDPASGTVKVPDFSIAVF